MEFILSGIFIVDDYKLYDYLRILNEIENKRIEFFFCVVFEGVVFLLKYEDSKKYIENRIGKNINNVYYVCWVIGGKMVF